MLWILLALLVLALVALVVDRRLHQARADREARELDRLSAERQAQREFDDALALRLRAADAERKLTLEAKRRECQALMDEALPHLHAPARSAPRPATSGTTHHHYTHHADTPPSICSGSSSDSSSSCDSSSSSSGGGE